MLPFRSAWPFSTYSGSWSAFGGKSDRKRRQKGCRLKRGSRRRLWVASCCARAALSVDACRLIDRVARANDIPGDYIARLISVESGFSPTAVSPKGAQGIAQFMPETARLRGLADPFEPGPALKAAIEYLSELRHRFGNLGLAAAAYNAGERRVKALIAGTSSLPLETRNYVFAITGRQIEDWLGVNHPTAPFPTAGQHRLHQIMFATRSKPVPLRGSPGCERGLSLGCPNIREFLAQPGS